MKIVEIFKSIDGEGSRAGFLATFIRMHGCNLRCSYCDSMYANEGNNYKEMNLEEILHEVRELGCRRVTLTGGEPLMTDDGWRIADYLAVKGFEVNIETNGSIALPVNKHMNIFYTMDYKCPSSGMEDKMVLGNLPRLIESAIHANCHNVLKFVVGDSKDLYIMKTVLFNTIFQGQPLCPRSGVDVFVSPVFGKIEPEQIVEYLKCYNMENVRLQLQLHKIIWDPNLRGV